MSTNETPGPVPAPALQDPTRPAPPRSGCLKWVLGGCGVLSAILIVGLVAIGLKARSVMEWALVKMEDQTLSSCTPDVTTEQRDGFRRAYAGFIDRARQGKVPVEKMSAFRTKLLAAVGDGKVTPVELDGLTEAGKDVSPPPAPAK